MRVLLKKEIAMDKFIREIRVFDLYRYFALPLFLLLLDSAFIVLDVIFLSGIVRYAILAVLIFALYFILKYLVIGSVLMYKAFAPMEVRDRCRFEPTCSTYMIIAVKKYGLFIGVYKGIRRLLRCHPPNGGEDYP